MYVSLKGDIVYNWYWFRKNNCLNLLKKRKSFEFLRNVKVKFCWMIKMLILVINRLNREFNIIVYIILSKIVFLF